MSNKRTIDVFISDLIYDKQALDNRREEKTVVYQYDCDTTLGQLINDLIGSKPIVNDHIHN